MNQRQLNYFLEVYHRKSISHAASALFISPQALSKSIATLETELGVTLFLRKSNRIIPTKAARNLVTHAKNLLQEYDIIENKLFNHMDIVKKIALHCSYDVPQMIDPAFFFQFHQDYPELRLRLMEYPDQEIIQQLKHNEIELAIIPGNVNFEKFCVIPLFSDSFCLIVSKDHMLADKKDFSLSDLQHESIVAKDMNSSVSKNQGDLFLQCGISSNVVLESSDSHLLYRMVEEGLAVCITLKQLTKNIPSKNLTVIPFPDPLIKKQLYLVYKNDCVLSPEAETLKGSLLTFYKTSIPSNIIR